MNTEFLIGKVQSVDTGNVSVKVDKEKSLNNVQINQIVQIRSTKTGEKIIGLISKIMRKAVADKIDESSDPDFIIENLIKINLVGTLIEKVGSDKNVFKRTLNTVPSINADCFLLQGNELSTFMNIISSNSGNPLKIGKYTISEESAANLDGNKFFQRHAVIVGGTGSGKSWTVATILEKATKLQSINSVVFDLHGEYKPLAKLDNTTLLKIAGPSDKPTDQNVMFLPYWLLSYEEIESMLLDRSDSNAPNQSRALFDLIIKYKKEKLEEENQQEVLNNFTVESPIPYNIDNVLSALEEKDSEMVPGARTEKQGPLHGKLTRFIQRLKSKQSDKRLNFIFNSEGELLEYDWFVSLVKNLLDFGNEKGLKIIDFSEVPSDILPLITGLIGRLIFSIQQWMEVEKRHPIALFCDEAHLYIPANPKGSIEEKGLQSFERIAKEGRKYGISLVVISQRPSDVNKTILSQCGNFVAMRLTNPDDQNVIKRLFPDNLGGFSDMLPILDIGEALIVGDAALLPSRVIIDKPTIPPDSATIDFWDEWNKKKTESGIEQAVKALRKQQK
ncbi:Bipolar DNA helicase [uncultured Gammaproteobacteria bacterium]|nr:Bipolar DNA helicase [uncultured Gammaproteobacteria bacterium]CAC9660081.1 Bipolar DNA helicase [uncultured Gammaproteobacteria bacterium]CAC9993087.1 Bipolar DNA helicase [uncultured Gammaproteobacteria bacterium]